ncbi:hypothetical protein TNCT_498061 [Trichonephila clavata]|uniref:RNase H type-1 domain-containing protein n=1 Tax=Trichonephila clavata TaxID=2740835 RepID=A0A8X6L1Q8_TRICU|nr:hypothetical protein TNCT_498061 [Trichonephila clavata]
MLWHLKKKDIRFCWIPGHAGITVNELADTAARSATGSSERFPIPHSDLKACFRQKLQSLNSHCYGLHGLLCPSHATHTSQVIMTMNSSPVLFSREFET